MAALSLSGEKLGRPVLRYWQAWSDAANDFALISVGRTTLAVLEDVDMSLLRVLVIGTVGTRYRFVSDALHKENNAEDPNALLLRHLCDTRALPQPRSP